MLSYPTAKKFWHYCHEPCPAMKQYAKVTT